MVGAEPPRERLEVGRGAEQTGAAEVEQRPEIDERVLDRRAGEEQAVATIQRLDGVGLLGLGVLDRLGLVEHHQAPRLLLEPVLALQRGVGGEHDVDVRGRSVAVVDAAVGGVDAQVGAEARELGAPVAEQRGRQDDQVRASDRVLAQEQQQRDHLDRLAAVSYTHLTLPTSDLV